LRLKLARQNGVCTFFDYMLIDCLDPTLAEANQISIRPAFLLDYLARRKAGRFVDFFERQATFGTDIPHHIHGMSQGVSECLQWKGRLLFKSVFDLAIYQALFAELRPATVIEIGSGNGGSAVWFADLMRSLEIEGHIYSLDLHKPEVNDQQITFLAGDCASIESILHPDMLASWPTPWLVIEDAHANVSTVLDFFDRFLRSGDYLVVEDSKKKENIIGKFLLGKRHKYRVDTRYTDLLGKNATSCFDSILRHM
jgi:cephalosporin hydroxylase